MAKLSDQDLAASLQSLPGWTCANGEIRRAFEFPDYYQTIAFVNAIAWVAHQADHHPDLEVGYNRCVVRYSTHSEGGVTALDVANAGAVQALFDRKDSAK